MKESATVPIENMIDSFLESNETNTYFLLYLIVKLQKPIPRSYIRIILNDLKAPITFRKGIIIALAIVHNPGCVMQIIEDFEQN